VRGPEALDAIPDGRPGAEEAELRKEEIEALDAAVDTLPPQQRQCLLLRVRHEMPYEEIARTLLLSVNTVRNHLAAARRGLRVALEAHFGGEKST
jgi:RNA polymerase sigma-70 factor (ECF subfamily)